VYEAITIMAKRANQINLKLKELTEKLEEFATYNDSLEEVLKTKNKLIQNSMKKITPPRFAVQEWLDGKIYHRDSNK
jgi:DNA-directed RNA polymerase subunit K/omega